jgi:hypothetical protein
MVKEGRVVRNRPRSCLQRNHQLSLESLGKYSVGTIPRFDSGEIAKMPDGDPILGLPSEIEILDAILGELDLTTLKALCLMRGGNLANPTIVWDLPNETLTTSECADQLFKSDWTKEKSEGDMEASADVPGSSSGNIIITWNPKPNLICGEPTLLMLKLYMRFGGDFVGDPNANWLECGAAADLALQTIASEFPNAMKVAYAELENLCPGNCAQMRITGCS